MSFIMRNHDEKEFIQRESLDDEGIFPPLRNTES